MKGDKLIYFFNCYFLMLDYDEPIEKIVKGYIDNESDNNIKVLMNDLEYIVNGSKDEELNYILNNADELNISIGELKDIIEKLHKLFKRYSV